jgi:hypothetical protein
VAYLSGDASLADIRAAYRAACTYDVENDVAKCREYIQALRFLLELSKNETRQGSASLREEVPKYERELAGALAWLAARDEDFAGAGGGGVVFADLRGFRD